MSWPRTGVRPSALNPGVLGTIKDGIFHHNDLFIAFDGRRSGVCEKIRRKMAPLIKAVADDMFTKRPPLQPFRVHYPNSCLELQTRSSTHQIVPTLDLWQGAFSGMGFQNIGLKKQNTAAPTRKKHGKQISTGSI